MSEHWYPGEYRPAPQYPPHYKTMPEILRVVDTIAPTLAGKRQDYWLRCRTVGLAEWKLIGIPIRMLHKGEDKPNRVTLKWMVPVEDQESSTLGAWHQFNEDGSDWIHFEPLKFEQCYLSNVRAEMVYLVAHEFGHSLGFGHGGDGIMDPYPQHAHVNEEEAAVARAYWGIDG